MSTAVNMQAIAQSRATRFNPLAHFTPEKLTAAISDFRSGRLRELALIMEAIEETDDVLMSVVPKAKAAVARSGWEVLTIETEDPAEAALAVRQAEVLRHFYNNVRATSAWDQDELGGFALLLRQMMDAKGKRYSVHNIVWKADAKGRYTATFWHTPLAFFENSTGRMRYISAPYGYDGEPMEPGSWLVTKGAGVMIACSIAWMFKHLPLQDWLLLCEKYALPGMEGVTDAQKGSPEWQAMVDAVMAAGRDFAWVRNRSEEIKPIDFKAAGNQPHPPLVERMDRALSALWRGADLSTISAGSGSGQGASLQGGEADLIEEDDAAWLTETLQYKVDRLVLDYAFGPDVPALAYVKVLGGTSDETDRNLKIDEFCIKNGHPVSQKQIAERYSRPIPAEGDALLRAPAPTMLQPGGLPQTGINERQVGRDQVFRANALRSLSTAQREALAPLTDRLAALDKAQTPEDWRAALTQLQTDLPELYTQVAKDRSLATAFEAVLGAAAASGLATAAAKTPSARQSA